MEKTMQEQDIQAQKQARYLKGYSEALVGIAEAWTTLSLWYREETKDINRDAWMDECVRLAQEFVEQYGSPKGRETVFLEYAAKSLSKFAGLSLKPVYITFGSWEGYPYQDTYIVVYGKDMADADQKFREKHPDKTPGILNYAFSYTKEQWNASDYPGQGPAAILF